jgi:hypothetical protein
MDAVQPALLGEAREFHKRYEAPLASGGPSEAMPELKKKLLFGMPNAFVKRRNKTELVDLPPKHIERLSCEMSAEEVSSHIDLLRSKGVRKEILERFGNKDGFNVLILSPFVAGIGLTITEANHVIHYGRWWNPAVESQATDRVYRIGQMRPVFVHLPIYKDPSGRLARTFDERLDALLIRKESLAQDFLQPADQEDQLSKELCDDLLTDVEGAAACRPLRIEDVDRMNPFQFEAFVACIFEAQGYKTVLTAKGNDGGADVLAVRRGELVIVQVKHCSSRQPVDEGAIGDLLAAQTTYNTNLRFSLSMVAVTNTTFTEAARALAATLAVKLMNRDDLERFLQDAVTTASSVMVRESNRSKSFRGGIEAVKVLLEI